jgi:dTDP-glucose pyrophosphorylase
VNVLVLAAGAEQTVKGESYPLCLAEFNSVPLIESVATAASRLDPGQIIVLFRNTDIKTYHLDSVVRLVVPNAIIVGIEGPTQGAACSALLAARHIDNDEELLILAGNEFLNVEFLPIIDEFRRRGLHGGLVVFESVHPRYSFVKLGSDGLVIEASEKNPISNNATAGFYWFRSGSVFVNEAKNLIRKDANVNGSFYICPTYNELILKGLPVGVFKVDAKDYHPLKDERQFHAFGSSVAKAAR